MGTPAQVGRNEYNATITQARLHLQDLRRVLKAMGQEAALRSFIGPMAMDLLELTDLINRLEEIGRNTKEL